MEQISLIIADQGNFLKVPTSLLKYSFTRPLYLKSAMWRVCYLYCAVRKNLTYYKWFRPSRLQLPRKETKTGFVEEYEIPFFELHLDQVLIATSSSFPNRCWNSRKLVE